MNTQYGVVETREVNAKRGVCESDCMASERRIGYQILRRRPSAHTCSSAGRFVHISELQVGSGNESAGTGSFIPVDDEVHVDLVGQQ